MRNYQKELEGIIEELDGRVPRLLLHACCAPCSSYVIETLSRYFDITVDYYNPNISPEEEYRKRAAEILRLTEEMQTEHPVRVLIREYDPEAFREAVRGLEREPEGGKRCEACFRLRLQEAARTAKEGGYDYFTTTLTISPLKNAALLNEIGEELAKEYGIKFLPSDFKKRGGYQRSIELSKEYELYRQDFCGCVYSRRKDYCPEGGIRIPKSCERTAVTIDLDAVRHNVESILALKKRREGFMAVVKADGYGHGAVEIAKEIQDLVWGFAAAAPEEALELLRHGITRPVLLLGRVPDGRIRELVNAGVRIPVFEVEQARKISEIAEDSGKNALIHIKVDTGMHRIGLPADEEGLQEALKIASLPGLEAEGVFTHLATADMVENEPAKKQIEDFRAFVAALRKAGHAVPLSHYANSAASILFDCGDSALLRVGVALYGMNPSGECDYSAADLRPALSWDSEITYVKTLPAGVPVSYGGTFVTEREMRIATVSVGYADGYPRSLSNSGEVLLSGKRCRILGRVCMDQLMIDVSAVPEAMQGMRVTLVGRDGDDEITMEELGNLSGRFNYELACDISKRVPRIYRKNGRAVSVHDWFET